MKFLKKVRIREEDEVEYEKHPCPHCLGLGFHTRRQPGDPLTISPNVDQCHYCNGIGTLLRKKKKPLDDIAQLVEELEKD